MFQYNRMNNFKVKEESAVTLKSLKMTSVDAETRQFEN